MNTKELFEWAINARDLFNKSFNTTLMNCIEQTFPAHASKSETHACYIICKYINDPDLRSTYHYLRS